MMYPYAGYGLLLEDVTISDLDDKPITGGYTVNWYRVNPFTFELTAITGEHGHLYTTSLADVGYYLMVEILGDGVNVGGFTRIFVEEITKIHNKGFVENITNMGFDIGFEYEISLEMLEDLMIVRDSSGQDISYYSIETTATPYVYQVNINMYELSEIYIEVGNPIFTTGGGDEFHMWESIHAYIYEW